MKSSPKQLPKPANQSQKATMSYPMIEKLIETEDFSQVSQTMTSCYDLLERMLKDRQGGLSRQKKIRQALKAYDLTMDLIKDLLHTKHEMLKVSEKELKGSSQKK